MTRPAPTTDSELPRSTAPARYPGRIVYISQGNIPSRWAHTFQVMKQAEAFTSLGIDCMLATEAHWLMRFLPAVNLRRWYGVSERLRVVRIATAEAPLRRVFAHVYGSAAFASRAAAFAQAAGADLVFTRHPLVAGYTARHGISTIVETHVPPENAEFADFVRASNLSHVRALVTISEPLAERYRAAGMPEHKILVAPDAVNIDPYSQSLSKAEARRKAGVCSNRPVVVYSGHLYDEKGIPLLIEAARQCRELDFILVGGWPADVRRRREEAKGLSNVRLTGFVPNSLVPNYLAAADVLALPNSAHAPASEWTSPLKLFEYMAARRPILAADLPVFRRHLRRGENCRMFVPDNLASICSELRIMVAAPEETSRLADVAWQDVQTQTWSRRAERILAFTRTHATMPAKN